MNYIKIFKTCHLSQTKIIKTYTLHVLDYFKIIFIFLMIERWTYDNTSFFLIVYHNSCILVSNNNMYATNQQMKMYFINFFFIQNSLSFVTNPDLFNARNGILIANVTCNSKLIAMTNHKSSLFF
jgi:hypothetical protein